jgi:sulfatase modifying factor 1
MKRHALLVALLCLSALFITAGSLNALTIPASEDSYTAPRNTLSYSTNNANSLVVDATRKSYLYFDLSDIPNDAVVRWAKLRLFLPTVRTPGAGLSVHLVTGTWNESTRLADVPSIVSGSLGMIAPSKMASRRFVTVDVKDTVQKWINGGTLNEGFAIQPIIKPGSPTASVMLTSKEGPVFGLPAELDIEFGPTFDTLPLSIRSYFGPTITAQPSAPSGSGDSLTVTALGMGALSYQWMRDGVAITGGTSSQLPTKGLQSGTYTVVVSNGFASVTSGSLQYPPSLIGTFALVTGGTLPAFSELGPVPVDTFYIGKTEVTWGEWQTVRTWAVANGYTDLDGVGQGMGDNYPVTHVNWFDCVKWCNARSEKEGKTPVYKDGAAVYRTGQSKLAGVSSANGYRLPSEAEWEFAARGGTLTKNYTYSGGNDLDAVGWSIGNAGSAVHEVGKKQANELGIYDMSGNLFEWCGNWYPGQEGSRRIRRGGSFGSALSSCTVSQRDYFSIGGGSTSLGFRVALSAAP